MAVNFLLSGPSAASDEPVADEGLFLDHNLAIFSETKPPQRCDSCPTWGKQGSNGLNAELFECVCQNLSAEGWARSPVLSIEDEPHIYIVTLRLKATSADEVVIQHETPRPDASLLPHSFLGGDKVIALDSSKLITR